MTSENVPFYDALAEHDDDDHDSRPSVSTIAALASALPNIYSSYENTNIQPRLSIEKYVNPLGTVTTITAGMTTDIKKDMLDEVVSQLSAEETVIHENCDEALFRPVVTIFCDEETRQRVEEEEKTRSQSELCKPPKSIDNKLIVPVIDKETDDKMSKREKAKLSIKARKKLVIEEKETVSSREETSVLEKPIEFKRMTSLRPEKSISTADKKETAKKTKNSAKEPTAVVTANTEKSKDNSKTNITLQTKSTTKKDTEVDLKKNKYPQVKTEHLNICDLADSLIDLKLTEVDKGDQVSVEKKENVEFENKTLEVVEIYADKYVRVSKEEETLKESVYKVNVVEMPSKESKDIFTKGKKEEEKPPEEYKVQVRETSEVGRKASTGANKKQQIKENKSSQKEVVTQQPLKSNTSLPAYESSTKTDKNIWKQLSGADVINKNISKNEKEEFVFSMSPKTSVDFHKKLLPKDFEDFPMLAPLEALPPIPALEPLELLPTELELATSSQAQKPSNLSLINFESPSHENAALPRKITPPPRGFSDKNLIYALCGSLHYENETLDKTETYSPSSSIVGEPSTTEYKSLTENDEQYASLDLSSQDTNTTNTNTTTNEKLTSSSNISSASEEVITMEEKKMSKRQKRKLQKSKKEAAAPAVLNKPADEEVDEELRPLIDNTISCLLDSQTEKANKQFINTDCVPLLPVESVESNLDITNAATTTDSEDQVPVTTSDDNLKHPQSSSGISAQRSPNQHKIKTKKLEHKINLSAAIEAVTSSSTSSAEDSSVEIAGAERQVVEVVASNLVSLASSVTLETPPIVSVPTAAINTPATAVVNSSNNSGANGGAKKKTKRRKR